MALTDLSDEISPFPDADNLLDYGGGDSKEANTNNNSFPLQKLRPIRSHSGNGVVGGGGDGDSPHTKLCSESGSGSGYGYSSPDLPVEVPPRSSNCTVDAAVNPSTEGGGGGTPLWDIVSKKLEQLGYQAKLVEGHPPLQAAFDSATTTTTTTTSNDSNHNNTAMVVQSSSPAVEHHPCSDPIEIANMLVALHSTSCCFFPETNNQKKRKTCATRQVEVLLLNMVEKVMKKQEEMHTQLIQMIDKQEKERMAREEAWRQQEVERQRKEQLMREEQTSRNLSLISLIETLLGEQNQSQSHKHEESSSTKRWPDCEVKALIESRTAVYHKFHNVDPKHNTWDEVSHIMSSMGYTRNAKKCKEKWENINKYFKRTVERGRRPKSSKTCPYFDELDVLYRNGNLNPGPGSSPLINNGEEEQHTQLIVVPSEETNLLSKGGL